MSARSILSRHRISLQRGVGLFLTALAVWLHLSFLRHAGGLWRDEVNSVNLAGLSSLAEVWKNLQFDSFPFGWFLLIRLVRLVSGDSDLVWRVFGFGIGVFSLGALWFAARTFKMNAPLLSLALLGFSSTMIRWGDSIRGYGLGAAALLFTFSFVWRVLQQPDRKNVLLACLAAFVATQSLYYNGIFVGAICAGALAVICRNRDWSKVVPVVIVASVAAISAVNFLLVFNRAKSWAPILQYPERWRDSGLTWYFSGVVAALNGLVWVWGGLAFTALACVGVLLIRKAKDDSGGAARDLATFGLTSSVVVFTGYYLFLRQAQLFTQSWYYLVPLALGALIMDVTLSCFSRSLLWNGLKTAAAAVVVAFSFVPAQSAVRTRMTNVDLVSHWLETHVASGDLVLVQPWYAGITFARYYHGPASWQTIPPMADHRFHRFDLLQAAMTANQSGLMEGVSSEIQETLRENHRVWVFGEIGFPKEQPASLLPAPQEASGWQDWPYYQYWAAQTGYEVRRLARPGYVNFQLPQPVNPLESFPLFLIEPPH